MWKTWATVSFSITMLVECNAVLLVGNYVAKIPQFSKYFLYTDSAKRFLPDFQSQHWRNWILKYNKMTYKKY